MKKIAWLMVLAVVLLGATVQFTHAGGRVVVSGHHWAGHHHWRGHTGLHFYWGGPIVFGPWWYPYNGYYYPPRQVVPAPSPPIFVRPEPQPEYYWYYCQDPQGYYPYVKSCPGGWMKVVPQEPKQ